MKTFTHGINEAFKIYDELPKNISHPAISAAAAKALLPVKQAAKAELLSHAKDTDERAKTRFVARNIRIKRNKRKQPPGARVLVDGPDIFVGSKKWTIQGYAKLIGEGAYKTPYRKGKGKFKGFGNYVANTGQQMTKQTSTRFDQLIQPELRKNVDRTIRRYKTQKRS